MRAGRVRMTFQGARQRGEGSFGISLAKQEYGVVDVGVFVGRGSVVQPYGVKERVGGLGGLAQGFEREREQAVRLTVLRFPLQGLAKAVDGGLKAVEQVERA